MVEQVWIMVKSFMSLFSILVQNKWCNMDNNANNNKIIKITRFQIWYLVWEVNGKGLTNFIKNEIMVQYGGASMDNGVDNKIVTVSIIAYCLTH